MIVGIDLGTTNSAVAIWRDDKAQLVPNALGNYLTPSAISLSDSGTILVGSAAYERRSTHPKLSATNFKRLIGTQKSVAIGKLTLSPEELSSLVLRSLKIDAEAFTGEKVAGAVITVPAYFNDRQRKATRRAGELAGLKVERLINEPTAAALAFGVQDRQEREPFLVFDLGGGTFDVSLVEMFDSIIEVRASSGDNRLGGEDFNSALADLVKEQPDFRAKFSGVEREALEALLLSGSEQCRRQLSESDAAVLIVVANQIEYRLNVTSAQFEERVAPLLQRLRDPVLQSLRDSNLRAEELSEIVLVGGATRMPIVRRAITRMFGRFPNTAVHPDYAVALGAAVQAGLLEKNEALDEIRLTDVCPFTLGVEHAERDTRGNFHFGLFSPIIDRNTAIPTSRVKYYSTLSDNQKEIKFGIYQGEARDVSANVKLGEVRVPVPPKPAGEVQVDCRFTYDSSGLLEVDVTVPSTGLKRNILIKDDAEALEGSELDKRRAELEKLKLHPRESAHNSAILARATRCYETLLGDLRDHIGHCITQFEAALDSQDPRNIHDAQSHITAQLDLVDRERFL